MLWSARGWTLHLMLGVGTISRYMSNPGMQHWAVVKWILRYRRGTPSVYLIYGSGKPMLEGFKDSDVSGDGFQPNHISVCDDLCRGSRVMAIMIAKGCGFVTMKAEYMVAVESGKELIWMRDFLCELGMEQEKFLLHCDDQSAIHLAKNVAYHSCTNHIQRRCH